MLDERHLDELAVISTQYHQEENYWLQKLGGELVKSHIPYDMNKRQVIHEQGMQIIPFEIPRALLLQLMKFTRNSDLKIFITLAAVLTLLLKRYTGHEDIIIGAPIFKQAVEAEFINTVLVLRNQVREHMTFRELLSRVSQTLVEADKNRNYPLEMLLLKLKIPFSRQEDFPLFDISLLLENIHKREYLCFINHNVIFSFIRKEGDQETLEGKLEYNSLLLTAASMKRMIHHFIGLLQKTLTGIDDPLSRVDMLPADEKKQVLFVFNNTVTGYPGARTIRECFERHPDQKPDDISLVFEDHHLTYGELNKRVQGTARVLRKRGVGPDTVVGLMVEPSIEMPIGILGILEAGGAYLPIDPGAPGNRIRFVLKDSSAPGLLIKTGTLGKFPFTMLQGYPRTPVDIELTSPRPQIKDLDVLPIPNRSLIDYDKYSGLIGMAMARHTIALQATRGCPYKCLYCHKIWPKTHMVRSAHHLFSEIRTYYHMGIRRFVMVDDIFNLNAENSSRFYELLIKNKLKVQIFFPNGMRGDILTRDYIDLMVEAGVINIGLALETASPRLQKLIRKNLDIEKLRENMLYICKKHPQVILELFTMHGFPTETEAEAWMTMDFIKSLKWLHWPNINILKVYPDTEMAGLCIANGISAEAIARSEDLAFHELPETLPFDRLFTIKYQAEYLDYFLSKERLLHVLPYQMKTLTRDEIVQKYNSFLPTPIHDFNDLLQLAGIDRDELGAGEFLDQESMNVTGLHQQMKKHFGQQESDEHALRILLLDLSQFFSGMRNDMLYDVSEPPLGLMCLMTFLQQEYGNEVIGKIAKSRIDFDNYTRLKALVDEFKPDVLGIRALTFYRNLFHQTAAMLRHYGFDGPIISGGPYATSDYKRVLQDRNIDVVVMGEGEITFAQLIGEIMVNNRKLPSEKVLRKIPGLAFVPGGSASKGNFIREIFMLDWLVRDIPGSSEQRLENLNKPSDGAYIMYTSGSTGKPKGVIVAHESVVNLVHGLNQRIYTRFPGNLNVSLMAPFVFDASVKQIFAALLLGYCLYIVPEEIRGDWFGLREFLVRHKIDISDGTPTHIRMLLESLAEGEGSCLGKTHFLLGGELLPRRLVEDFCRCFRGTFPGITNVYGPTECCVDATSYRVTRENISLYPDIPIGKPMPNYRLYIINEVYHLQPIGAAGELCISGIGAARGYLNSPELTSEKFIEMKNIPPGGRRQRIYRTGDLARWLEGGDIQFMGRRDHQVKIRGFRIELGEIENRLAAYEGVKEVVVICRRDDRGDQYLCAYIISHKTIENPGPGMREYLSGYLPEYMIPRYFIFLEGFPLTSNGKLDRKGMPEPELKVEEDYIAPKSKVEKKLSRIWSEVLGVNEGFIGIDANFFQLGGQSLKATILSVRLQKELSVKLPLGMIFDNPTIRGLAQSVSRQVKARYVSIRTVEKRDYYVSSSAQKRLYILHQLEAGSITYNSPLVMPLGRDINRQKLEETFIMLTARHESLRTSFAMVKGQVVQRVHEGIDFGIENHRAGSPREVEEIARSFIRPFDLSRLPLLRVSLVSVNDPGNPHWLLFVDMHHIITDGMSQRILTGEFNALYAGEEVLALRVRYKDYAEWQQVQLEEEGFKQQEEYWSREFEGEIPVLDLPIDFPRLQVQSFAGAVLNFEIGRGVTDTLRKIAQENGATLFMVLLSLYNILLAKLSSQEDIIVGTDIAGRSHPDLEHIIGMFVNTLALRNFPGPEKTFSGFLHEVKEVTLKGFENQDYQFEVLVEQIPLQRDTSRNPLFDVMFSFIGMEVGTGTWEAIVKKASASLPQFREYDTQTSKFDLTLGAIETTGGLFFAFEYCTKLFQPATIQRFITYFQQIVSVVTADKNRKISGIEVISPGERQQILFEFNQTKRDIARDKSCPQLFEEEVSRHPGKIAAVFGDQHLTYAELADEANQIAYFLQENGLTTGSDPLVGLYLRRNIHMLASIIGIFKAGAGYLPLEIDHPKNRVEYILKDSGVNMVVTETDTVGVVDKLGVFSLYLEPGKKFSGNRAVPPVFVETAGQTGGPNHLAYMIYTSGTTGKPKGVMVHRLGMLNHLYAKINDLSIDERDVIAQTASITFDISVWQFLAALLVGGTTVIIKKELVLAPGIFLKALQKYQVTILETVPSLMAAFLEVIRHERDRGLRHLRWMIPTGEPLMPQLVKKWYRYYPGIKLVNAYGPTEAADDVTHYVVNEVPPASQTTIPIGKPLQNIHIYILDRYLKLCPVGIKGEICVAGIGVGKGYWKDVEKTRRSFIPNPFLEEIKDMDYARLYRTGDIGYFKSDGTVACQGRLDHQVKIRGNRIELGEIERQLLNHPRIKEAVVISREMENGKYLCAYVRCAADWEAAPAQKTTQLREFLSMDLPGYMIPDYFVYLEKIPLSSNWKVDRKALPEPEGCDGPGMGDDYIPPADEIEEKLVSIWKELLKLEKDKISTTHNFFELGGNSLHVIMMVGKIWQQLETQLPVASVFENPTIRGIARNIRSKSSVEMPMVLLNQVRPGKIFCFPPQIAYGYLYAVLASIFDHYSWYGFHFIEEDDRLSQYVEIIKELQPLGPYLLLGYSAAGKLTFQVARELEKQGRQVSDIILLDCIFREFAEVFNDENEALLVYQDFMNRHYKHIDETMERLGLIFLKETVLRKSERYIRYYEREPMHLEKINATVHLLVSEETQNNKTRDPRCWDKYTAKPALIYRGFGGHREIFNPGNLERNAEILHKIFSSIERRKTGD